MQYDPIKRSLGRFFNKSVFLRKVFYRLLDWLLLRSWHVRKELKKWNSSEFPVILDAGSGFGQYTYRMSQMFPSALIKAVDVKEEQIADCNEFFLKSNLNSRVIFEKADLTRFVEPEQFDLILSVDVMEHIEEDVKVFENFYKTLKQKSMLLISTPSDQGGSDAHDHDHEGDGVAGFIDEHVRDGYNINEIKEKLKKVGFSEVHARYQYGKPGSLAWRLSMKYPIKMLGVSKLFFILLPFYYIVAFPISAILNWFDVRNEHQSGTGLLVTAFKN
ncbi:MAG: class I SAM-dependent methyltransferase [Prolixibacteraceae bacterium]|jgi:SAM-dependent methyltransferase|nr:class I SAM-dependent methyltransferase [Prolixibacteraceae bacterium]